METIKHSNIIYMPTISALGGIETYVYEMVKKYKDLDIAVVSKTCNSLQAKRIKQYCPLYIHTDQKIECDVAIINYDTSIINYINENAKIYQCIHADYTSPIYNGRKPLNHPRITGFITITKFLQDKMKELLKTDKVIMSYNPLTVEEYKPFITLVSATRLHQNKGVGRMKELIKALERNNVDFIWYVITNDVQVIKHPNVIMIPNRLDVDKWLNQADYVVLLSDSEACSYTLNEALYRNIPIISTPLPYLEEIGVKDEINSYIVEFDCSNVDEVAKKITNIPKFIFKPLEDNYKSIFKRSKSDYEEEREMEVRVKTLIDFSDIEAGINRDRGDEFICSKERADYLVDNKAVIILEEIKEEPKKEESKKEEKPKTTKKSSKK